LYIFFTIKHETSLYSYSYILFTELDDINIELYIQETEKLKNEILSHNVKVNDIICKINKLEKWVDFVEFEGMKYGIQKIYNNVHILKIFFFIIKWITKKKTNL